MSGNFYEPLGNKAPVGKVKYELRADEYVVAVDVSMDIPRRIERL